MCLRPRCSSVSFCAKPSIAASTRRMPSPAPSPLRPTAMIRKLSRARGLDHLLRTIMIGRDHRRAAGRHEIAEQPQLGGEVVRDVGMIIHVIARQIGKAAGGDAHAVEPVLVEPVR